MDIIEQREDWLASFKATWLAHFESTGETDFKNNYKMVKNSAAPRGAAISLASSRLLFVTSSGAYLKGRQQPFDAKNPLGDPRTEIFDLAEPLDAFAFAHDHYDHAYVDEDPQSVLPLRHLEDLVQEGVVGSWASRGVSFSGYIPNATQVVDEILPTVFEVARAEKVEGALLVPV